jgi:hypothetical protein
VLLRVRAVMAEETLWFISENGELINVFSDRDRAQEERFYLKEENPLEKYKLYEIPVDELEEFPDEYDFALQSGYLEEIEVEEEIEVDVDD